MIRWTATRRHLKLLKAMPPPPAPPEPPTAPMLTVYQGRVARGIAAGNQLVTTRQVQRGDT